MIFAFINLTNIIFIKLYIVFLEEIMHIKNNSFLQILIPLYK